MKFVSERSHNHHSDFITLGTRQPTLDGVVNNAGKESFNTVRRPFQGGPIDGRRGRWLDSGESSGHWEKGRSDLVKLLRNRDPDKHVRYNRKPGMTSATHLSVSKTPTRRHATHHDSSRPTTTAPRPTASPLQIFFDEW